jgi:hypothetical protein
VGYSDLCSVIVTWKFYFKISRERLCTGVINSADGQVKTFLRVGMTAENTDDSDSNIPEFSSNS